MTGNSITATVVYLLFVAISSAFSECPHNAQKRVQQCTSSILPDLSPKPGAPRAYTNHVQVARETCRNSRLREAADCIQGILDRCRGTTEQEQVLQRLIDKKRMMDTIDHFCQNFRVYERNAKCIEKHHSEVENCTKNAQESFVTKMKAGATMDVLIMGSCRFMSVARTCLTDITRVRCGEEAGNFVYTLMSGGIPPYCEEGTPEYRPIQPDNPSQRKNSDYPNDSSTSVSVNIVMMLLVSVIGYLCSRR